MLNFFAPQQRNTATGYGKTEAGLLHALRGAGVTVNEVSLDDPPEGGVTLIVGSPEWRWKPAFHQTRVWVYTMSESTRTTPQWVGAMNACERVFVPCPPLVDVYRESGVHVPIAVIPIGLDPLALATREVNGMFHWLTYSLGDHRKNAEAAMKAFHRLFAGDAHHHLTIKCRDNPRWLTGLQHPQMTLITGEVHADDWYWLMARSHAFIFPSRGEGFGLPPREATLTGMPTVATQALGMWDVDRWGYPLSWRLVPNEFTDHEANAIEALWYEPSLDDVCQHMAHIAENYPAALDKARAGREYLLQENSWGEIAECWEDWILQA